MQQNRELQLNVQKAREAVEQKYRQKALISMEILVWFADRLTWLTWNLVLVWMMIHGGYVLIRMMVSGSTNSRY